jgi:dTMP kinase
MSTGLERGCFITIEGIEGVGKSTQISAIVDTLRSQGKKVILTREPGGTELGEAIRHLLLSTEYPPMNQRTELLLMFAARAEHIYAKIIPALDEGCWVVSDRFTDASYAYQGGGRNIPLDKILGLEDWVQEGFSPDFTILLDAPVEVGLARAKNRGPQDRIEQEDLDFFQRVRDLYLERATAEPERFRIIDASNDENRVKQAVLTQLDEIIQGWSKP